MTKLNENFKYERLLEQRGVTNVLRQYRDHVNPVQCKQGSQGSKVMTSSAGISIIGGKILICSCFAALISFEIDCLYAVCKHKYIKICSPPRIYRHFSQRITVESTYRHLFWSITDIPATLVMTPL